MVFETLAQTQIDHRGSIEEVKALVDQRVSFMRVFVDILEAITLEEPKIFSLDATVKMLGAIVRCMSTSESESSEIAYNKETTDELKSLFLHLWLYVAQQDTESGKLKQVLESLAKLTPGTCFSDEFIYLNLRAEAQHSHLE